MSKPIHMRDAAVMRAIEAGADPLDGPSLEPYRPSDPTEVALIREALNDFSPRLSGAAAREYLIARLRDHGIG